MELQVKINNIEFDKAQSIHRYYLSGKVADIKIELPKSFRKFKVGMEGKVSLFTTENTNTKCENGILLHGKVLSIQNENKRAILSFGGLVAIINLKSEAFSEISEGLEVYLCIKGFGTQ